MHDFSLFARKGSHQTLIGFISIGAAAHGRKLKRAAAGSEAHAGLAD